MTITSIRSDGITRPDSLMAAVALIVIGALLNLASLPLLTEDGPPKEVLVPATIALSAVWLACAWRIWQGMKWAAIVGFIVTLVNGLLTVPGIFFAEQLWVNIACVVGVAHAVAVCWLLVIKTTRDALR